MKTQKRKQILPDEKVQLLLTPSERDLILKHAFLNEEIERPLQIAELKGRNLIIHFTLDDLDELSGAIAAEANHAKSKVLQRQLDAVFEKITDTLRAHDDGLFNDSLPR